MFLYNFKVAYIPAILKVSKKVDFKVMALILFKVVLSTRLWKLHNEELNHLPCSPNLVGVIKSRRMRYAGHVARMGERRGVYRVWWGNLRERDHL